MCQIKNIILLEAAKFKTSSTSATKIDKRCRLYLNKYIVKFHIGTLRIFETFMLKRFIIYCHIKWGIAKGWILSELEQDKGCKINFITFCLTELQKAEGYI